MAEANSTAALLLEAVPNHSTCIEMLREICEEARALPRMDEARELTVRLYSVQHWLLEGTPLPPDLIAECLEDPGPASYLVLIAWQLVDEHG